MSELEWHFLIHSFEFDDLFYANTYISDTFCI